MRVQVLRRLSCAVLAVAGLLVMPAPARAQASDAAAVRSELAAIRQSLDQIALALKELLKQNQSRDLTTALLQRLDAAERRVTLAEAALRDGQKRQADGEAELVKAQASVGAFQEMAKQDTTGAAAGMIAAEQARIQSTVQQKAAEAQQLGQAVQRLEADLMAKQKIVTELEQALNRQFGGR